MKKKGFPTTKGMYIRVAVYVPNTQKGTKKFISNNEHLKRARNVAAKLRSLFEGSTRIQGLDPGRGTWKDPKTKRLYKDKIFMVESFCTDKKWKKNKNELAKYLRNRKKEWGQTDIAVVWEDMTKHLKHEGMQLL